MFITNQLAPQENHVVLQPKDFFCLAEGIWGSGNILFKWEGYVVKTVWKH
jgi:hypothetical protein